MAEQIPLVIIGGQVQQLPVGDSVAAVGKGTSNQIASDKEITADTSYVVMEYLIVEATLTLNGNVGIL